MLPIIYLNEIVTLVLWGASGGWIRIILLASHAPIMTYASWFLYKRKNKEKLGNLLSTTNSFIRFTLLGVLAPVIINSFFTFNYAFVDGNLYTVALMMLADFLTIITIATPILYFLAPLQNRFGFWIAKPLVSPFQTELHSQRNIQFWIIVVVFVSMIFFVNFDAYWFVYGVVSIIVAIQRGFGSAILINGIIFVLNYILPLLDFADVILASKGTTKLVSVHLGMAAMLISSSLIGRVISDLWKTEYKLTRQKSELERANNQLTKTNDELDRFVYSLSHDISAPLKSIRGLVNLSRMENTPDQSFSYLAKIETSINKLEQFIAEVLDYSRTNRKDLDSEDVELKPLVTEIIDDYRYLERFEDIQFKLEFEKERIQSDKFLLRVALSNLISNAIKYQRSNKDHRPFIRIAATEETGIVKIVVEDNGEGIAPQFKERIFEMFYRGSSTSTGSGLGLYIAKEAIEKLNGKIEMTSEYEKGTSFTIYIPVEKIND